MFTLLLLELRIKNRKTKLWITNPEL